MKVYISHPNSIDFKNELYEPLKKSDLATAHEFFLPHDNGRDENTQEEVKNSELLIAEVSEPSTGSGIEIGWASAFNVPIWCIYREDAKPSGSAKYVAAKTMSYKDSNNLILKLQTEFASFQ